VSFLSGGSGSISISIVIDGVRIGVFHNVVESFVEFNTVFGEGISFFTVIIEIISGFKIYKIVINVLLS